MGWLVRLFVSGACAAVAVSGASARAASCSIAKIIELPVTFNHHLPFVRAKIGDAEAFFVVDNSTLFSRISPGAAAKLGLKVDQTEMTVSDQHSTSNLNVSTVKNMTLEGAKLAPTQFLIVDSFGGETGVLGRNLLDIRDVEFDFPHNAVRLMHAESCAKADLAYWAQPGTSSIVDLAQPENGQGPLRMAVWVNGVKLSAALDSSASTSYITRGAATRVHAAISASASRPDRAHPDWPTAALESVTVGSEEIRKTQLRVLDPVTPDAAAADVRLGVDFFRSHRMYISKSPEKLYFTYVGGPVFETWNPKAGSAPPPKLEAASSADAEALSRRAQLEQERGAYAAAEADLGAAMTAAPKEPRYAIERASVRTMQNDFPGALADLDRALAIQPNSAPALVRRAALLQRTGDEAGALSAADLAARTLPPEGEEHLDLGRLYAGLGSYERSISEFDQWIRHHPVDSQMSDALNCRCWSRALGGIDLPKAKADCDRALRIRPRTAAYLDSRALLELREGQYKLAVSDYDAALALRPGSAQTLYARGVAKEREGLQVEGEADIKAALAIDPAAGEVLKKAGIAA